MHIIIYGHAKDCDSCIAYMNLLPELQYRQIYYKCFDTYDGFVEALDCGLYNLDLVIVLADGAQGMEGVMACKRINPDVAVIWFSDDEGFGIQSYRLDCTFFAPKPLTEQLVASAIGKYQQDRIN